MAHQNYYNRLDQPVVTYSNIVYYGPFDRSKEIDPILKQCEETGGNGLIIDDNTVYEVDCECYRQMQLRKAKKNNGANSI